MLNSISHLNGAQVIATDGDIGKVKEAFFDDRSWAIRYLVVDAGTWLTGREVLISPYAVKQPLGGEKHIRVTLSRAQVKNSPDVDAHMPVSRQHELEFSRYYDYPEYWNGGNLWGTGAMPYSPATLQSAAELAANRNMNDRDFRAADVHLRSSANVTGYEIQATDDSIGKVQDFVFDDENWAIRYLVVDTSAWWQGGNKVLVGIHWAESIDWSAKKVLVRLTRAQVKASPAFEDVASIHREYEMRLHRNYDRPGYWL